MTEQQRKEYRKLLKGVLDSPAGVLFKYPGSAHALARMTAMQLSIPEVRLAAKGIYDLPDEAPDAKELEPIAQECIDKRT
jgi:hypothetical protein